MFYALLNPLQYLFISWMCRILWLVDWLNQEYIKIILISHLIKLKTDGKWINLWGLFWPSKEQSQIYSIKLTMGCWRSMRWISKKNSKLGIFFKPVNHLPKKFPLISRIIVLYESGVCVQATLLNRKRQIWHVLQKLV